MNYLLVVIEVGYLFLSVDEFGERDGIMLFFVYGFYLVVVGGGFVIVWSGVWVK